MNKNNRYRLVWMICGTLFATGSMAQSLDDQYRNFLSAKCTRMNFDRDGSFNLLPGQAGPGLTAFCNGTPPVGGGNDSSSATSSVSLSRDTTEDAGLRRRREQLRGSESGEPNAILTDGVNSAFLSVNYSRDEQDSTRFEGGTEANSVGLTLGADRRMGAAVVGIAARLDDVSGDFTSGGEFESRGYGATAYVSWLPFDGLFVDIAAGGTRRDSESRRVVSFSRTLGFGPVEVIAPATAASDADQTEIGGEARSGYDWSVGRIAIGPRVSATYRRVEIDGYAESGPSAMRLVVEEQEEKSLRGSLGAQASRAFTPSAGVFVLQGNVDWIREFEDDQRVIRARLVEDLRPNPTRFDYQNQPPDRSVFSARISLSAAWRGGLGGFIALDGLFGHEYQDRYGAAIGLRKAF